MYKTKQPPVSILHCSLILLLLQCLFFTPLFAQPKTKMSFVVSVPDPSNHLFHVQLTYTGAMKKSLRFFMCSWTPGFYEIADFGGAVSNFSATNKSGKALDWKKGAEGTWDVESDGKSSLMLSYDVKADNPFIANANLNENYGYFVTGAIFMYLNEELKHPLTVQIKPYKEWPQTVATGLDQWAAGSNIFLVQNFDVLYDSPFLMGKLEKFPSTLVKGKPLQFIGHDMAPFDRKEFMANLTKIANSASKIIGEVPYNHYTFLGVGMNIHGFGGIEHLNSVSLIMANSGKLLAQPEQKENLYSLLAHEYFHLYNVKRIRPIALGPFDYTKENYTNMLWVSEGFTDYYEYLIMRRAGLMSAERVLENYEEHIRNYENTPGHLYQSVIQASRGIWAQRGIPQQRTPEEMAKTISVYDKGCALGMLLDLKIRHETHNRQSLDDVMRSLYKKYYQTKKRGFTDHEFQQECELIAGVSLKEVFSYANTVTPVNYPKYLAYAGLAIDTMTRALPGLTMGAEVKYSKTDSTLIVRSITWPSSAFNAGLKAGDKISMINGVSADQQSYDNLMKSKTSGDEVQLQVISGKEKRPVSVVLHKKEEKSFKIAPLAHPDALQSAIYKDWLRK